MISMITFLFCCPFSDEDGVESAFSKSAGFIISVEYAIYAKAG